MFRSVSLDLSAASAQDLPRSHSTLLRDFNDPSDSLIRSPVKKMRWTADEDRCLEAMVGHHGTTNWAIIATSLPGRSGKQCRERWTNQLNPALNREEWTPHEDAVLIAQQKIHGNSWSRIAQFLPHRSSNGIKNRWCCLTKGKAPRGANDRDFPTVHFEFPAPNPPQFVTEPPIKMTPNPPKLVPEVKVVPPPVPVVPVVPVPLPPSAPEPVTAKEARGVFPGFDWLDPRLDPFAD
jgi:hypothetical protein